MGPVSALMDMPKLSMCVDRAHLTPMQMQIRPLVYALIAAKFSTRIHSSAQPVPATLLPALMGLSATATVAINFKMVHAFNRYHVPRTHHPTNWEYVFAIEAIIGMVLPAGQLQAVLPTHSGIVLSLNASVLDKMNILSMEDARLAGVILPGMAPNASVEPGTIWLEAPVLNATLTQLIMDLNVSVIEVSLEIAPIVDPVTILVELVVVLELANVFLAWISPILSKMVTVVDKVLVPLVLTLKEELAHNVLIFVSSVVLNLTARDVHLGLTSAQPALDPPLLAFVKAFAEMEGESMHRDAMMVTIEMEMVVVAPARLKMDGVVHVDPQYKEVLALI